MIYGGLAFNLELVQTADGEINKSIDKVKDVILVKTERYV